MGAFSLLRRERDYRRVLIAEVVSLAGDWFAVVPLVSLLAALTGGGLAGGLALAADTVLFALVAPYGGALADRHDRRRLMVLADAVSAVLVLALLGVTSASTAWVGVLVMGLVAVCKATAVPSGSAAVPNLVPPGDLATANLVSSVVWGGSLAGGAALSGLLVALVGVRWCFVLDAVSFAVSALLVASTRRPFQSARVAAVRSSVWRDLVEAGHVARRLPRVLVMLTAKAVIGLGNGPLALFPLLAERVYHSGPASVGLMFAARGVGALVGGPMAMRLARTGRAVGVLSGVLIVLFGVAYAALPWWPILPVGLLLLALGHAGGGGNWTLSTFALQVLAPDQVRGRVLSADLTAATLAVGGSQLVAGLLSDAVPVRQLTAGFGVVVAVGGVGWLLAARSAGLTGPHALPSAVAA